MTDAEFTSQHWLTESHDPVPDGGVSFGSGFAISWQRGALVRADGSKREPNGTFVQTMIKVVIDRIEHYQTTRFKSQENASAIWHLRAAYDALEARQRRREAAGTAGTHKGS